MSADNQQERPDVWLGYYIAGFVDGEGSFHVAIQKSRNVKIGDTGYPGISCFSKCK